MRRTYKPIILATTLFFASAVLAYAAPGDLDPTFGNGGIVVTSFSNAPYYDLPVAIKVQPDGKVLVCGEIRQDDADWNSFTVSLFIARYHPNGTLDASFGTNGKVVTPINSGPDFVGRGGIALQPDGKIVLVGWNRDPGDGFAVSRYNSDGTVDASFGLGGKVLTQGDVMYAAGVAVQPDGRLVVVGARASDAFKGGIAVVRYNPDGSLDTNFGEGGKSITQFSPYAAGLVVMLQSDGRIVVAGRNRGNGGYDTSFTLVRYHADGSLDSAFGVGGKVVHKFPNAAAYLNDALLQPDNRIVVTGSIFSPNPPVMAIVRYNADGSVDTNFGTHGVHTSAGFAGDSIALQPNGKIVLFGSVYPGISAALRLDANGSLDQGFAPNGFATTNFGNGNSTGLAGAIQPDGRILFLGYTWVGGDVVVARFLGDATPCPNPIDCPDFFISQQYRDFLGREPEGSCPPNQCGLDFYMPILKGCGDNIECTRYTRGALSANFFRSPEFGRKGAYLANLFNIVFGQRPKTIIELSDPSKVERPHYAEFMTDLASLSTPTDDPLLDDQKKNQLTANWLGRTEVQAILPNSLTNEQFVHKLGSIAGVTVSNEDTLIASLNFGGLTRARVLRAVAESPEIINKFYIQNFVTMEYFGYLRRDPEDCHASLDPLNCGYIFHNNRFNTPGADPDLIENFIVRGFIESPEYRGRFGLP